MRLWDAKKVVYGGLRALQWPRYMSAMWILGAELAELYSDQLSDSGRLIIATLDLVRDVSIQGEVAEHQGRAARLTAEWGQVISDGEDEALAGLLPTRWWTQLCCVPPFLSPESEEYAR